MISKRLYTLEIIAKFLKKYYNMKMFCDKTHLITSDLFNVS